jgi:hypothetical protein
MKKITYIILLCLCALPSYALMTPGEFGIEMAGGYSFTTLGNFNANFTNVFNSGFLDSYGGNPGYSKPVSATAVPGIMYADIKLRYAVAGGLPLYLRLGLKRLVDTEILHNTVADTDIATSVVSFNQAYIGGGIKYGFKLSPGFSIFLGADGGCFIPINSYWEVTGNTAASPPVIANPGPAYNAYQKIDFTDIFFGANAGAGIEWAITNSWGITLEAGYKLAKTPVTYAKTGIFARTNFDFTELDFSGPYATGGLVFYFGGKPAAAGRSTPDAPSANGDYYYGRKEYAKALAAYSAEYKQTLSNSTYKKIGITFYVMGMKQKAVFIFTRYLQTVPGDSQVRGWLQKLEK